MAGTFSISTIFIGKDRMSPTFDKMRGASKMFGNTLKNLVRTFAVAFSARQLIRFGDESIKMWNKQAEAIANVEATLQSTGGTVGRTLEQLENQAKSFQANTFIGDESILEGVTAQLLTFKDIQGDVFDRTQRAVIDVTAKLNGLETSSENLKSISIALGKALNDPISNLGALSRSGIQFSDAQKLMIKQLAETNQLAAAQDIILAEIEKTYGGTAEALALTTGGIEKSVQNMIGDTKEMIGKGLVPIKLELLNIIKDTLPGLAPAIKKFSDFVLQNIPKVRALFEEIGKKIKTAFDILGPPIKIFIGSVVKIGKVLFNLVAKVIKPFTSATGGMSGILKVLGGVLEFVGGFLDAFASGIEFLSPILAPLATAIGVVAGAMAAFNLVMSLNPIGIIILAIGGLIAAIGLLADNWDVVVKFFKDTWDNIVGFFQSAIDSIVGFLKGLWDWFMKMLDNPFLTGIATIFAPFITLPALIIKHWEPIQQFFSDLFGTVGNAAAAVGDFFGGIGDFISGKPPEKNPEAPNLREIASRQEINFKGYLNILGASEGSTFEQTTTGAPPIKTELLGVAP
jgi:phage-related protein